MKYLTFFILLYLSVACVEKPQKKSTPRLVIGIVVDQMRQEYLHRFYDKFSESGFKRLMNEGFQFKNGHYNYAPTYTAPGHASIYTGTTPSKHGIIGNTWYAKEKEQSIYCVMDLNEEAIGGSERNGRISPRNLQASTLTDELKLSSNFRSKVIGIAIKDRGAVLPAGHSPDGVFWFDDNTAEFMSSSYYFDKLPDWVLEFNKSRPVAKYLNEIWNPILPIEEYVESTADDSPYERVFKGKENPVFPYNLNNLTEANGMGLIKTTPFGNSLVLDMALASIKSENLGRDELTDFLAISFSSTDYIGHYFGPNSIELEDTYLRLDIEIKKLLDYLDEQFKNDYLIFLTADHGVVSVPSFLKDHSLNGGYYSSGDAVEKVMTAVHQKYGNEEWILNRSNDQIFLNKELIRSKDIEVEEFSAFMAEKILALDYVSDVFSSALFKTKSVNDPFAIKIQNGFHPKMSGDIVIVNKPGYLDDRYPRGTTHGSSYNYDTHVPILFFGKGIPTGESIRNVSITDIAPTISMLLDISLPDRSTGEPLIEIFE